MTDQLILKGTDFLIMFLSKENHMLFISGMVVGAVIGGLIATFVVPMFWKPKA